MMCSVLEKQIVPATYGTQTFKKEFFKIGTVTGADEDGIEEFVPGRTYDTNAEVYVPELHSIFASAAAGVTVHPLEDSSKWSWRRYENKVRMFALSEDIGSKTKGTNIKIVYDDFSILDSVAILGADFITATITHKDENGDVIEQLEIDGKDISCGDSYEYAFLPAKPVRKYIYDEFFPTPDSSLEIQFVGYAEIETVCVGLMVDLAATIVGGTVDWEDESQYTTSQYTGYISTENLIVSKVYDGSIITEDKNFNWISTKIDEIFGKYILFRPVENDQFDESITIGRITRFSMPTSDQGIEANIRIQGVGKNDRN